VYSIQQTIARVRIALEAKGKSRSGPNFDEARAAITELERLIHSEQSILDLGLDGRTIDVLDAVGVESVEQLERLGYDELVRIDGIKHGRATEILEALGRR
jgi:DNA-directed RNA polymerase alpha subunit